MHPAQSWRRTAAMASLKVSAGLAYHAAWFGEPGVAPCDWPTAPGAALLE